MIKYRKLTVLCLRSEIIFTGILKNNYYCLFYLKKTKQTMHLNNIILFSNTIFIFFLSQNWCVVFYTKLVIFDISVQFL